MNEEIKELELRYKELQEKAKKLKADIDATLAYHQKRYVEIFINQN